MTYRLRILRRAWADADAMHQWLCRRSPPGAAAWYDAFYAAADALRADPTSYGLAPEGRVVSVEIRQSLFKTRRGKQYRILFSVIANEIRILRVRGPGQAPITKYDVTE